MLSQALHPPTIARNLPFYTRLHKPILALPGPRSECSNQAGLAQREASVSLCSPRQPSTSIIDSAPLAHSAHEKRAPTPCSRQGWRIPSGGSLSTRVPEGRTQVVYRHEGGASGQSGTRAIVNALLIILHASGRSHRPALLVCMSRPKLRGATRHCTGASVRADGRAENGSSREHTLLPQHY